MKLVKVCVGEMAMCLIAISKMRGWWTKMEANAIDKRSIY